MKKPNIKHRLCSNYICTGNVFIVMCKTLKVPNPNPNPNPDPVNNHPS